MHVPVKGPYVEEILQFCVYCFSNAGAAEKAAKEGEGFKQEAVTNAIKERMRERQRVKEESFDMVRYVVVSHLQ